MSGQVEIAETVRVNLQATIANSKAHGGRGLLVFCGCEHDSALPFDGQSDHASVPDVALRLTCSACGLKGRIATRLDFKGVHTGSRPKLRSVNIAPAELGKRPITAFHHPSHTPIPAGRHSARSMASPASIRPATSDVHAWHAALEAMKPTTAPCPGMTGPPCEQMREAAIDVLDRSARTPSRSAGRSRICSTCTRPSARSASRPAGP